MSFIRKVKYYLVHTLKYSNKKAQQLLDEDQVEIDGQIICENCVLEDFSEIKVSGKLVREKKQYSYLKFYKPVGLESTLNKGVPDNLSSFFSGHTNLSIAGRLDKQSEGLLLLSDDGKWVEKICHPLFDKEKEYEVTLTKLPDAQFIIAFENGVLISGYKTKPCICEVIEGRTIRVILKEGKNRQIRKMCKTLGFEVEELKRVRIDTILLGTLKLGEHTQITNNQ